MIQYWIQTPIENARESCERLIHSGLTSGYNGYELSYSYETEVVAFNIDSNFQYDFNTIYFGELRVSKAETGLRLAVSDITNTFLTFDTSLGTAQGRYPFIIFNEVNSAPSGMCYFHGYKFTIDAIAPQFSYLLTEAGEYLTQENGFKIVIQ